MISLKFSKDGTILYLCHLKQSKFLKGEGHTSPQYGTSKREQSRADLQQVQTITGTLVHNLHWRSSLGWDYNMIFCCAPSPNHKTLATPLTLDINLFLFLFYTFTKKAQMKANMKGYLSSLLYSLYRSHLLNDCPVFSNVLFHHFHKILKRSKAYIGGGWFIFTKNHQLFTYFSVQYLGVSLMRDFILTPHLNDENLAVS